VTSTASPLHARRPLASDKGAPSSFRTEMSETDAERELSLGNGRLWV
jgi:hypothetical protein